jgi:uncharacterized protein YndB with AHSA1/START domain
MTTRNLIEKSVQIHAPAGAVWATLVTPTKMSEWLAGATVQTTWEVGSDIVFDVTLNGKAYHDVGTVLAFEPMRLLRYNQWSAVSRLPDSPETRSTVTLKLEAMDGGTRLSLTHEHPAHEATIKHVNYFWGVALHVIRERAEADQAQRAI